MSPQQQTISAFEERYLERARETMPPADEVVGVLLSADPHRERLSDGAFIAGWWCDPALGAPVMVLPNPWDDRAVIPLFADQCWEITHRLITRVAPVLNEIHGTDHPDEYFELLFGLWLALVVAAVTDRHLFCLIAHRLAPDAHFLGGGAVAVPRTLAEAVTIMRREPWNQRTLVTIANAYGYSVASADTESAASSSTPTGSPSSGWRIVSEKMAKRVSQAVGSPELIPDAIARRLLTPVLQRAEGRQLTVLGERHLAARDLIGLAREVPGLRIAGPPGGASWLDSASTDGEVSDTARDRLAELAKGDGVEDLVLRLLPEIFPRSLLEGYQSLVQESIRRYGPPSHVLKAALAVDEVENEFIARSKAAGKRLAFTQHGGSYQQLEAHYIGRIESERDDCLFLSWGGAGASSNVRPMPDPYLERLRDRHGGGEMAVIVEWAAQPDGYLIQFSTIPLANQTFSELRRAGEFAEAVRVARPHLVLKRFPGTSAEGGIERPPILEALPQPSKLRHRPAVDWMRRARVAVITYPDTPFIEAMVLGVPVIGIWNFHYWNMRQDAAGYFDELAELGIIHSDPVAAAAQLDEIYSEAAHWWSQPSIKAARQRFLSRFARSGDWRTQWAAALRELSGEGGASAALRA